MDSKKKIIDLEADENGVFGFRAISFVDDPAIQSNFIYMNKMYELSQVDTAKRIVCGPVLIPDQLILRRDAQTGEEYYIRFSADTIRNIAYGMMKSGRQFEHTVMHKPQAVEGCTIVETWLKAGESDKSVELGLDKSLPVGTWFSLTKVDNDQVWNDVELGKFKGWSIEAQMDSIETNQSFTEALEEITALLSQTN